MPIGSTRIGSIALGWNSLIDPCFLILGEVPGTTQGAILILMLVDDVGGFLFREPQTQLLMRLPIVGNLLGFPSNGSIVAAFPPDRENDCRRFSTLCWSIAVDAWLTVRVEAVETTGLLVTRAVVGKTNPDGRAGLRPRDVTICDGLLRNR